MQGPWRAIIWQGSLKFAGSIWGRMKAQEGPLAHNMYQDIQKNLTYLYTKLSILRSYGRKEALNHSSELLYER